MDPIFASEKLCDFVTSIQKTVFSLDDMIDSINLALPDLAEEMLLGKLSVQLNTPQSVYEPLGINREVLSYENPEGFENDSYEKNFITEEHGKIIIAAYLKKGAIWTPANKKAIDFFVDLTYLLCSRARLLKLMSKVKTTDALTGCLNLHGFQEIVGELLSLDEIHNFAVIFINFKNFKYINRKVTPDNGDIILRKYSMMVMGFLENEGYISRLGGDNFLVLVTKHTLKDFLRFIQQISITVNNKGVMEDVKISIRAGVYEADEETTFGDIMSNSAVALTAARHSKEHDIIFFRHEMLEKALHDKGISNMFMDSLAKNEFKVYYQPKVDLRTNKLCGCEALSRWYAQRQILPSEFIPILESEGTIKNLDFYVLNIVCKNIREWLDKGIEPVRISTNFSKLHLSDERFEERIIEVLKKYDVNPSYLELELTELSDYQYFDRLVRFVNTMKTAGFKISIDDFGTGYSSMSLIRNLNPDVIKLDKSLIDNVAAGDNQKSKTDRVISRSIINMAHELGINVIAEGVETKKQATFLKENNCLMAQGFLFDKALEHDEFEKRLISPEYEI
ncbi:bifunctional diguanylate cyclase/phosphodiesterase [uncultured Treponema sp.]|uniref:putative bifunctional diguanylate cyclase/phosphodiesterase n=1 Tax=uncultured Treponema sp. TaxID=162155 RepID=UPI0025EAA003|nr:GGDEF domain-containing phosphodiesterase [uncultured Treponema sp.]